VICEVCTKFPEGIIILINLIFVVDQQILMNNFVHILYVPWNQRQCVHRLTVVARHCLYMPLVLKAAIPLQQTCWWVLQFAKKESVTDVKPAFLSQFHLKPSSRSFVKICHKIFEKKECMCKDKIPGRASGEMQVWTVFGLASSTAYEIN